MWSIDDAIASTETMRMMLFFFLFVYNLNGEYAGEQVRLTD